MIVLDFVQDSYRIAGIISEIESPSPEQGQKAVTRLNDLMAALAEDGIDLGYNPKASTADTLALPDGSVLGLKSMLAVSLCSDFGLQVPPIAAAQAQNGLDRLLRQAVMMQNVPLRLRTVDHGDGNAHPSRILTG